MVLRPIRGLMLTADWYEVDVRHRIVLSDQLKGPAVSAILAAHGVTDVQQAQFFTNAAHTRTEGYELSADYARTLGAGTRIDAGLQYGQYRTSLLSLAPNPVLPASPLLGATSKGLLISAQPRDKLTSELGLTLGRVFGQVSVEHYGSWVSAPLGVTQTFSGNTLVDLTARLDLTSRVSLSANILDLGDVHPDLVTGGSAIGLPYGEESPFGDNGRSYYLRLDVRL
jgi:iron complex outermembrane receptor protein